MHFIRKLHLIWCGTSRVIGMVVYTTIGLWRVTYCKGQTTNAFTIHALYTAWFSTEQQAVSLQYASHVLRRAKNWPERASWYLEPSSSTAWAHAQHSPPHLPTLSSTAGPSPQPCMQSPDWSDRWYRGRSSLKLFYIKMHKLLQDYARNSRLATTQNRKMNAQHFSRIYQEKKTGLLFLKGVVHSRAGIYNMQNR